MHNQIIQLYGKINYAISLRLALRLSEDWWRRRESNLSAPTAGTGLRGADPHLTHPAFSISIHKVFFL